jgi:excisionase family DNA binding protein
MSADSDRSVELLTIIEVAELLTISVSGVRRLQQARHLPFIKVGGSVRFSKSDVLSYLEKRRVESID